MLLFLLPGFTSLHFESLAWRLHWHAYFCGLMALQDSNRKKSSSLGAVCSIVTRLHYCTQRKKKKKKINWTWTLFTSGGKTEHHPAKGYGAYMFFSTGLSVYFLICGQSGKNLPVEALYTFLFTCSLLNY